MDEWGHTLCWLIPLLSIKLTVSVTYLLRKSFLTFSLLLSSIINFCPLGAFFTEFLLGFLHCQFLPTDFNIWREGTLTMPGSSSPYQIAGLFQLVKKHLLNEWKLNFTDIWIRGHVCYTLIEYLLIFCLYLSTKNLMKYLETNSYYFLPKTLVNWGMK